MGVNPVAHRAIGAWIVTVLIFGMALLPDEKAHAQSIGTADDQGLAEIVVTATRRETDLEKTPISVGHPPREQYCFEGIDQNHNN